LKQKFDANSLPERLSVSIGGYFGPSLSVCLEDGFLIYRHSKSWRAFQKPGTRGRRRFSPRLTNGGLLGRRSTGLMSGAGRLITPILAGSAMEPVGPLKSFTRIDRLSLPVITVFQDWMEVRFPLPPWGLRATIPSRNSVAPWPT
jgi:hypothetical protein